MGFAQDTAITTNADFTKYAMAQQITQLLRGANTYDEIHKGAVNELCRDLRGLGYNPANISNTYDFESELVYWVLWQIFLEQVRDGNAKAQGKALEFKDLYEQKKRSRVYVFADTGNTKGRKSLPRSGNLDSGYFRNFGAPVLKRGDGVQVGRTKVRSFDDHVQDNPT